MQALFWIAVIVVIYFFLRYLDGGESKPKESAHKQSEPPRHHSAQELEAMRQALKAWDYRTYRAIANGSYTGPLPQQTADNQYTRMYPDIYRTKIAGINYRRGIRNLAGMYFACRLEAEPRNKYDKNAIRILHDDGRHLGYIPAAETAFVRKFLNNQLPYDRCKCHIDEGEDSYYDDDLDIDRTRHFLIGEIIIYKPQTKMYK